MLQPQPSTSSSFSNSARQFQTITRTTEGHARKQLRQTSVDTLIAHKKLSGRVKDNLDHKLLSLFIYDFQPFSIVDDKGFKEYSAALNCNYQLPSRKTISKTLIPAIYEECKTNTKEIINAGKAFCITTDAWSSINCTSYIALTAHYVDDDFKLKSVLLECSANESSHTSEMLSRELIRVTSEWGIRDQIIFAVSDNASNIQKALQDIGWKHMGCTAHTINLIVRAGLQVGEIETVIHKVKEIVKYIKRSNIANEKLTAYQKNFGNTPLKLILDVPTRWNSTYYMLQRFVELEEAVKSTLAVIKKELPPLAPDDWNDIKELSHILKPFEDATKSLSGELYCTASLVIPICNGMKKLFAKLAKKKFSNSIKKVLAVIEDEFRERLGNMEKSTTLAVCTFMDPRFKNLAFSSESTAENVKSKIIAMVAAKITEQSVHHEHQLQVECTETDVADVDQDEASIWFEFDQSVAFRQPKGTSTSRAIIEMQRYIEEEIVPRKNDPLIWWKNHKQMLPHLSIIAQERLCVLASSVPCERLFSKAGQILTERRNRLSDKMVQTLLFLNTNYNP